MDLVDKTNNSCRVNQKKKKKYWVVFSSIWQEKSWWKFIMHICLHDNPWAKFGECTQLAAHISDLDSSLPASSLDCLHWNGWHLIQGNERLGFASWVLRQVPVFPTYHNHRVGYIRHYKIWCSKTETRNQQNKWEHSPLPLWRKKVQYMATKWC